MSELYYEEGGEGFPMIFLHGNGEDHTYFREQIAHFSKNYRVIAIDTRGHGESPRGDGELTLARAADDLYELLCDMHISKAHIVGFSDGANIALLFAMKHPDMLERLVLNGGNLSPRGIKPSVQLPIELGYRLARLFALRSEKAARNAEILSLMVGQPRIAPSELAAICVPTLVIAGTNDMVKRRHTELIADSLPRARLKLLKGDHFIAAKCPREFNSALDELFSDNGF